ncbi:hypothetical protein [Rhodococcus sp. 27YEA6]|uniref:hypothetical protein n=1 Tax=Rhodococcus sp. 27YEA6 TaxID=3156273 RepID=UPI003839773A
MARILQVLDSEVVQRWAATIATILLPILLLSDRVDKAVENPSVWNWAVLVVIVIGYISIAADAIIKWRKHFARKKDA